MPRVASTMRAELHVASMMADTRTWPSCGVNAGSYADAVELGTASTQMWLQTGQSSRGRGRFGFSS
uniref:Uncharacterized protein n=1 Tax=Oryza barthii TaxID=65489 RepID=A0A0D3HP62_9ORYZ